MTAPDPGAHTLTNVTVTLHQAALDALNAAAKAEGDTRTDTINRALQVYAQLVAEQRAGWTIQLRRPLGGVWGRLGLGRVLKLRISDAPASEGES